MNRLTRKQAAKRLREAVEKYPPDTCYRDKDNDGHYILTNTDISYEGTITVCILHGRDSYLPGVLVFGVPPTELVRCDCGKWEPPTEHQIAERKLEQPVHCAVHCAVCHKHEYVQ